jgi:imidazolonepropionase-like amidohydrolase
VQFRPDSFSRYLPSDLRREAPQANRRSLRIFVSFVLRCGRMTSVKSLCLGVSVALLLISSLQPAATLYHGARLIAGDDSAVIEHGAILVEGGVISQVGRLDTVKLPTAVRRVDISGKTVMPALIATHVHPGFQRGTTYVRENYTRDTVMNDLNRALFFGVSVVQSQGIESGDLLYNIRAEQQQAPVTTARLRVAGRGIGSPNAGPGGATFAGMAYEVTSEADARQAVQQLSARKVDMVKIWVDDRNGRAPKLAAPLYRAIIDEAHRRGLKVVAHVFYHDDAVDLVNAGIDGFAHLVRDRVMDDALVDAIVKRGVFAMGNLSFPRRSTYASLPQWLSDGDPMLALLTQSVSGPVLDRMRDYFSKRDPKAVAAASERYRILEQSMAKLGRAGAKVILGADTGLEDHLFGMAEQLELQAMVDAGLTPMQGVIAATGRSAEFLGMTNKGALRRGRDADFLVLDANPLEDITNARRISRMVLSGVEIDRAALRSRIQ